MRHMYLSGYNILKELKLFVFIISEVFSKIVFYMKHISWATRFHTNFIFK